LEFFRISYCLSSYCHKICILYANMVCSFSSILKMHSRWNATYVQFGMFCFLSNVHFASWWFVFLTIHVHAEKWRNIALFIWVVLWSGDFPLCKFSGTKAVNVLEDIIQTLATHLWSNGWLLVEENAHPIMFKHKTIPFCVFSLILHIWKRN
jgi:hypothetical protein